MKYNENNAEVQSSDAFIEYAKTFGLEEEINNILNIPKDRAMRDSDFCYDVVLSMLLFPFMAIGDTTFLVAGKGVGKTLVSMAFAYVIALGQSLCNVITCSCPQIVLYLDGEIGNPGMTGRIRSARKSFGLGKDDKAQIWFRSVRLNLYTKEGRDEVDAELERVQAEAGGAVRALFLDNLTSMQGGTDSPQGWDAFYDWVMLKKAQAIAVIMLFHAHDDGRIRGSQMKYINVDNMIVAEAYDPDAEEDAANTEISVAPHRDRRKMSIRFSFWNLRNIPHPEAYHEIMLQYTVADESWMMLNSDEYYTDVLSSMAERGMTDSQMAEALGKTDRQIRSLRDKYGIKKYE